MVSIKNFLRGYVRALSRNESRSLNIKSLAEESAVSNARLREPLFFYAFATGKMPRLLSAVRPLNDKLYQEYLTIYETSQKDFDVFFKRYQRNRHGSPTNM